MNLRIVGKARNVSKADFSLLRETVCWTALIFDLERMLISGLWLICKLIINIKCFEYIVFMYLFIVYFKLWGYFDYCT